MMLSKICVLFLGWIIFGFVGYWAIVMRNVGRLGRISSEKKEEIWGECLEMITYGMFKPKRHDEADKDYSVAKDAKNFTESMTGEPFAISMFRASLMWPSTFPKLNQLFDEAYSTLSEKY